MIDPADSVLRAMTVDGSLRLIAVNLRKTASSIAAAHGADADNARILSELLAAAVLVRETVAPDKRVQMTLIQPRSNLVAEARPDGACRAFLNLDIDTGVGDQPLMQVAYHRAGGALHQSTIALPASAGVAGALMTYLQTSEQIIATVGMRSQGQGEDLVAMAFAVQLLPSADVTTLEAVTEILEAGQLFEGEPSPAEMIARLTGAIETTVLAESAVRFECTCSRDRVVATLAGLPKTELGELIAAGEPAEIRCDACNSLYTIEVAELGGLLARPDDPIEN